jgi:hypothetical protein
VIGVLAIVRSSRLGFPTFIVRRRIALSSAEPAPGPSRFAELSPTGGRYADEAAAQAHGSLPRWRTVAIELALVCGLVALALAVRLPYYQLIPVFTDETDEIYVGWLTAHGQLAPLTMDEPYIGSLWAWLLAGAFLVGGPSLLVPRTVMLAFGTLTVLATYALGRAWGCRLGGVLAAGLLATASGHVVFNSRVAWSNCMSPLFSTIAVWALFEAVQGKRGRPQIALVLSGLF